MKKIEELIICRADDEDESWDDTTAGEQGNLPGGNATPGGTN